MLRYVFLFILFSAVECLGAQRGMFHVVAERPTPVLNSPDFRGVFGGKDGRTLKTDRQGLIREVEFIALPGTVFSVEEELKPGSPLIYRVTTTDYPYTSKNGFYIDASFVKEAGQNPPPRQRQLPPRQAIIDRLLSAQGLPYVWGGNVRNGVPELFDYYPPSGKLSDRLLAHWQLRGLDCSGLLYEATDGVTPRNTSSLLTYGKAVPIAGLSARRIIGRLEPLDLIVWAGHVIIVIDRERTIESTLASSGGGIGGVVVRPLLQVLDEVMEQRTPVDAYGKQKGRRGEFVIRRWQ